MTAIYRRGKRIAGLAVKRVTLPAGAGFSPAAVREVPGSGQKRPDVEALIVAIGARADIKKVEDPRVFYAGDCVNGPTTVVEAVAAGKNAALEVARSSDLVYVSSHDHIIIPIIVHISCR